jgi:hypothetical protein
MDPADVNRYNELQDVESANGILQESSAFESFLRRFSDLAFAQELNDDVGAFLLHAHFSLEPTKRMVEETIKDEQSPAYKTAPRAPAPTIAPMRWYLRHDSGEYAFQPMEYSTDAGVREGFERLRHRPAFVSGYAQLLRRYQFERILGLAVTRRAELPLTSGTSYREVTDMVGRASMLRVVDVDAPSEAPLIATTWQPSISAWCQPQTQCIPQSHCVMTAPERHDHQFRHQHQSAGHIHHPQ